jgi:5-methylcytosine-specific restriction endonuclease McrA
MFPLACNFCLRFKPYTDFSLARNHTNGHRSHCKKCAVLATTIRNVMAKVPKGGTFTLPRKLKKTRFANIKGATDWCCRICLECKPIDDFPKNANYANGHAQPCKRCGAAQEKQRLAQKKAKDPEAFAEWQRAQTRKWNRANPEKRKAVRAQYVRKHRKRVNEATRRRRLRRARVPIVEHVDRAIVFARDQWICQLCHTRVPRTAKYPHPLSATIDHIIPISQGGEESYRNCVLAHFGCNSRKRNRSTVQQLRLLG